ncbi:MAG: hypothetical protein KKF89_01975, partial [Nanoarchaeota archaeon]|nr:hypothetical protein [Nanoarchaeota archaeon]
MKKLFLIISLFVIALFLISGCTQTQENVYKQPKSKEGAESTADKFAREWEQKDLSDMYDMFIPKLQEMKNKSDFVALMEYLESDSTITVRLDKISMESEDVAYAYYTVSSSLFEQKAPAMNLEYIKGAWRVDAFGSYFSMSLQEKKYFDKVIEITKKQTSLISDFTYNIKMHTIEIKYDGLYDTTYCPNFKQNFEDAKENYDGFISLDVPEGLQDYHNTIKAVHENQYKAFEEMYKNCVATSYDEKMAHSDKMQEYWDRMGSKLDEAQKMGKDLESKYQTEKEKAQAEI